MSFVRGRRDHVFAHALSAFALVIAATSQGAMAQANSADSNAGTGVGSDFELVFWQSVSGADDRGQLEAYLARYPNGTFAALAKAKIAAIDRRDALLTKSRPADPAEAPIRPVPIPTASVPSLPPVAVPQTVAAPAVLPQALPAPTVFAPAPTVAVTQPPQTTNEQSLSQQLRALGQSQGRRPTPGLELPPRPALIRTAPPNLPAQFCSAVMRNDFYDTRYKPAVDQASSNNAAAIGHMQLLQRLFQEARDSGNLAHANHFAAEAQDYGPVTKEIYADRTLFDPLFNQIMAIPIVDCGGVK